MQPGQGILAICHDLSAEADLGFYEDWYVDQHLPERLGCPGWREARRYEVVGEGPRWFTFYVADNPSAFATAAYRARLDDPTDETRRVMPWFRNMSRTVAQVAVSTGDGMGGSVLLATSSGDIGPSGLWPDLVRSFAEPAVVLSAHLWLAAPVAPMPKTVEASFRRGADASMAAAVLIEATRMEALADLAARARSALGPRVSLARYRFLNRRLADG